MGRWPEFMIEKTWVRPTTIRIMCLKAIRLPEDSMRSRGTYESEISKGVR